MSLPSGLSWIDWFGYLLVAFLQVRPWINYCAETVVIIGEEFPIRCHT